MIRLVLRTNAVLDAALGALLLLATWEGLYSTLHLPDTDGAIYPQVAGAFVIAVAYLLWIAHRDVRVTRAAALTAALAHGLGSAIVAAWLVESKLDLPGREEIALACLALALAAIAAADLVVAEPQHRDARSA